MITLSFMMVTTVMVALLALIDTYYYGLSYFEAFHLLLIVSNSTQRSIAVIFLCIGFISCFVIDYRLKKNE